MAFVDGLAASPDPSNDYVFDSQEFTPHDRLLQDARRDAQHFIDAVETSEGESKSQADLASFDYSRRELSSLPTELVDIIKDHVARLALGYNMLNTLSGIGPRMGDFKKLTYLVLRNCDFRDFPREVSHIQRRGVSRMITETLRMLTRLDSRLHHARNPRLPWQCYSTPP